MDRPWDVRSICAQHQIDDPIAGSSLVRREHRIDGSGISRSGRSLTSQRRTAQSSADQARSIADRHHDSLTHVGQNLTLPLQIGRQAGGSLAAVQRAIVVEPGRMPAAKTAD
jgi:hypothetical protein